MLTPREYEVLQLVARGMSTRKIAERLHISAYTVDDHRCKLLEKFQAQNAAELINKAARNNWIK